MSEMKKQFNMNKEPKWAFNNAFGFDFPFLI